MATTAINNLMDYQKAKDKDYRDAVNVIGQEKLSEKLVIRFIIGMVMIAMLLGFWLVYKTNIVLLIIGALCFFIGIFILLDRFPFQECH